MKHTVVITAELPAVATQILSQTCEVVTHVAAGPRTEEEMIDILSEADGAVTMLSDPLTRHVLQSNPHLRIVANYAVGTNNIDLDAARELKIAVTNTPGVLTDATADLTMALILAVTRRMIEGDGMMRRGEFDGWKPLMLLGTALQGKLLGIVGMGRIGSAVAKRATAFGMKIAYHARNRNEDAERDHSAKRLTLDELLESSDVVSLHAPLTAETRQMISEERLRRMKKTSYLINTARGALVDEAALARALENGVIAGAGLDVYQHEPAVEPRLLSLANVVLLPHIGSATVETRTEMARIVAKDVMTFLQGGRAVNVVA